MNATQVGAVSDLINAPFNNMHMLKFKIQPSVVLFTAINHCSRPVGKQKHLAQWGQNIMFMRCDWQFTVHFVSLVFFCSQPVATVFLIYSSERSKSSVGIDV